MGLISSGKLAVITIAFEVPTGLRDHEIGPWAMDQVTILGGATPLIRHQQVQLQVMQPAPPPNGQGRITPP